MQETFCPLAVLCLKSNTGPGVMAPNLRNIARGRTTRKRALWYAAGARWSRNKKAPAEAGAQVSGSLRHVRGGGASKRVTEVRCHPRKGREHCRRQSTHACTSRCILPRVSADVSVHTARAVHKFILDAVTFFIFSLTSSHSMPFGCSSLNRPLPWSTTENPGILACTIFADSVDSFA